MATMSPAWALFALALLTTTMTSVTAATTLSIGEILDRGGQFKRLLQLLNETQVGVSLQNQLNNTYEGFTVLAPTDNAFANLPPGALNGLSRQDQVNLLQYHVISKFYTFDDIATASNPIRTQSPYTLNVTSFGIGQQRFNVSSGLVTVTVNNAVNITKPLAVYSLDAVLLPNELFGTNRTAPATSPPKPAPAPGKTDANGTVADGPSRSAAAPAPFAALVTAAALLGAALFS